MTDAHELAARRADVPTPPAAPRWRGDAPAGGFDEWTARAGGAHDRAAPAAAHWQRFFALLGPHGAGDLDARQRRLDARMREDGATYTIHHGGEGPQRVWPLQLLPYLVAPGEWADIEAGVVQRARMLEATMADLYGPQRLLRDALLPASLVHAHPQYLRPAHGLTPAGGRWLHLVAFDLERAPEGDFRVLAQRAQAPSGLGYMLHNRMAVSPLFQPQFDALRVQRLAAALRRFLATLQHASPAGDSARVVLLTPGPANETYFEHVFLARYCGIALVEGADLTVRDARLLLKTVRGLERVDVVLRRVDDEFLDPLEMRADSELGVPGLMQALRAGSVVFANAPGAGVLESPGLTAFWPGVAERMLGEDLAMPAATAWWCGEASVWRHERERLANYNVVPTFPDEHGPIVAAALDDAQRAALRARIDADPAAATLQSRVVLSHTPVWSSGALEPRSVVLRVYAVADGRGGWSVLPGGLTRVAGAPAGDAGVVDPWLSMQRGASSIDTWVITDGHVDRSSSAVADPLTALQVGQAAGSLTSRSAEELFWLGRYAERAENAVQIVRVALRALPGAGDEALALLRSLADWHGLLGPVGDAAAGDRSHERRQLADALVAGLPASSGSLGLGHNLLRLRRCATAVRERLSPEHWRLVDELAERYESGLGVVDDLSFADGGWRADELPAIGRVANELAAIAGAQAERMTRDDGWRLLGAGRQLERLTLAARTLAIGIEVGAHAADDAFDLLLTLADSLVTYRARFQARRELLPLLQVMMLDADAPRSVAGALDAVRARLLPLAAHEPSRRALWQRLLPRTEGWTLEALAELPRLQLELRGCVRAAYALAQAVERQLFLHVDAGRRVWQ